MTMTNEEIVRDYLQARNKQKHIKILADLNQTSQSEIKAVLAAAGVAGVKAPKRIARQKTEGNTPAPTPAAEPDDCSQEANVYNQIEAILTAVAAVDGTSLEVRCKAGEFLKAMFADYLKERLELTERGGEDTPCS